MDLKDVQSVMLKDLQSRAEDLIDYERNALFATGVWSAYLNMLDQNSPACVNNLEESVRFYGKAIEFLTVFQAKQALKSLHKFQERGQYHD